MEFDILLLLARRPEQVFSARQIYEAVATDSYDAGWTGISSMIYKLRRKLGSGIIETVRGHGYKFVAPGTSPAPAHRAPSGVCEFDLKDGELL